MTSSWRLKCKIRFLSTAITCSSCASVSGRKADDRVVRLIAMLRERGPSSSEPNAHVHELSGDRAFKKLPSISVDMHVHIRSSQTRALGCGFAELLIRTVVNLINTSMLVTDWMTTHVAPLRGSHLLSPLNLACANTTRMKLKVHIVIQRRPMGVTTDLVGPC